jgi:hypothetical protein
MLASAPPPACIADLAAMRAATGGSHWETIAQTTAFGRVTDSGLHGTARLDTDLVRGRSAQRFALPVVRGDARVDDGRAVWYQDISGGVHAYDAPFERRRAITDEYLDRRGEFAANPAARITCVGTRVEDGRSVVVIRVQPRNGIPADLAIDPTTHLLASVSERLPTTTSVTRFADYRQVGDVVLPFAIASGTLHEPANDDAIQVLRYAVRTRVDDADFAKPIARNDVRMLGGATTARVPMLLERGIMMAWVSIDGSRPLPFILDTGGHAILTAATAAALGIRGYGAGESGGSGAGTIALQYARVRTIRIGDAELREQPMLIIPYPAALFSRGKGKPPIAGILGLEIFERFATRLDFAARTITFTPLERYRDRGHGHAVPIVFQEDMPLATASADGHPGLFGIDTGNSGTLILFGDFLRRTGIRARYPAGLRAVGRGTGGEDAMRIQKLRHFAFGGAAFTNLPCAFTAMPSGSFSSWTEAGNLGVRVLSHFTPTFDYARGVVDLDPR